VKKLLFIPVLFVALIVFLSTYLQPNDFFGCQDAPLQDEKCGTADAIVVISGGDTVSRTSAGVELYKQGWAPYIVFSGAAKDKTGPSNAEVMRDQALQSGVPQSAIIIDELAETTHENAQNSSSIFAERGIHEVILVTSGYHQRRAALEFNQTAENITIRNYPIQDDHWGWWWWLTPRGWWLATGETVKIIVFYGQKVF